jgi:hypothetical protein
MITLIELSAYVKKIILILTALLLAVNGMIYQEKVILYWDYKGSYFREL